MTSKGPFQPKAFYDSVLCVLQLCLRRLRALLGTCLSSLWAGKSRIEVLQKWGALGNITRDTLSIFSCSCKSYVVLYSQGRCKLSLFGWLQHAFIHSLQVWFCLIIFETVKTNSKNVPHLCSAFVKLIIQILPGPHWVRLLLLDYLTLTVVLSLQDTVKFAFCLSPGYCC